MARKSQLPFYTLKEDLNDCDIVFLDDFLYTNHNRIRIIANTKVKDELSDYVKMRLFLARQLALLKYEKAHA